jgi:hypothetical protein
MDPMNVINMYGMYVYTTTAVPKGTLALPRGCTCNYDLTHISVQALDTSQGGGGCSLLLCILRLCQSFFKMPLIENTSSVEMRAVIRFLNAKKKSPTEIHKEVVEVYGENVISRKQVWV